MTYDASGLERVPFNGYVPAPSYTRLPRRNTSRNHGPLCSGNPEVGCLCDYDPGEHETAREED